MQNRWRFGRGLAALIAATLFSVPQLMFARQGCDNGGNDRNYYQTSHYRTETAARIIAAIAIKHVSVQRLWPRSERELLQRRLLWRLSAGALGRSIRCNYRR